MEGGEPICFSVSTAFLPDGSITPAADGYRGNGFHMREYDGRDTTNYVGNLDPDGKDVQPVWDDDLIDKLAGWKLAQSNGT